MTLDHCLDWWLKGMAFTLKERQILGIHGLLPPNVCTPDEQKSRVMNNVRRFESDLDKYIYLVALLDRNEKLFYQVHHLFDPRPSTMFSRRNFNVANKLLLQDEGNEAISKH